MPSAGALTTAGILSSNEDPPSSTDTTSASPPADASSTNGGRPGPAAATVCNLLPVIGAVTQGHPMPTASNGIYIGEGLPPVPLKLAERIRRWNFIDMSELLPEFWTTATGGKPDDGPAAALGSPAEEGHGHRVVGPVLRNLCRGPVGNIPWGCAGADGLPCSDNEGEPGFWGSGLGKLRPCLPSPGRVHGLKAVVQSQPLAIFNLFQWGGQGQQKMRLVPQSHP